MIRARIKFHILKIILKLKTKQNKINKKPSGTFYKPLI